jgi:hypothetical protein
MTVTTKITVFWDVALYSLVEKYSTTLRRHNESLQLKELD